MRGPDSVRGAGCRLPSNGVSMFTDGVGGVWEEDFITTEHASYALYTPVSSAAI